MADVINLNDAKIGDGIPPQREPKEILSLLLDSKPVTEQEWERCKVAYNHANNKSLCPCGSGKEYQACCKQDYLIAGRMIAGAKVETKKQAKEQHEQAKDDKAREDAEKDVNWMCRIGLSKDGTPVLAKVEGQATVFPPEQVLDVLMVAADNLRTRLIAQMAVNQVMNTLQQMSRAPAPPMRDVPIGRM